MLHAIYIPFGSLLFTREPSVLSGVEFERWSNKFSSLGAGLVVSDWNGLSSFTVTPVAGEATGRDVSMVFVGSAVTGRLW